MFLVVRSSGRLQTTLQDFKKYSLIAQGFQISKIAYHKLSLNKNDHGIVITSPHAALAIPPSRLPLFCVGEATAEEAKSLKHRVALIGEKGAADMAEKMVRRFPPHHVVHAVGDTADTSWHRILEKSGFGVTKTQVYSTEYASALPDDVVSHLKTGNIKCVVLFSEKGATHFLKLIQEAGVDLSAIDCVAFSKEIAQKCTGFRRVAASPVPNMVTLLQLLESVKKHYL